MFVKIFKICAYPSYSEELTVRNTVLAVSGMSRRIKKVIVCISWFTVKVCNELIFTVNGDSGV